MADKNHNFAIRCLHHAGFLTRSDMTSKFVGWDKKGDIGRADIFAGKNGKAINVEVKRGNERFQFDDWREPQRNWASYTESDPYNIPYWLFFTLGTDPPNWSDEKYLPRRSWLMPYQIFLEAEQIISPYQKSIVYRVKKGMNKKIQDNNYDAITLFKLYELKWAGSNSLLRPHWLGESLQTTYGGFWYVQNNHPLTRLFDIIENKA